LAKLLDFFQIFVDKCHHAKEEEVLFPALLDAGLPREGGPDQVMLAEHATGRKLVSDMYAALANYRSGAPGASDAFTWPRTVTRSFSPITSQRRTGISEQVQAGMI